MYVDPYSQAKQQADAWRSSRPSDAALLDKIASQPQGFWFGGWSGDVRAAVDSVLTAANGKVPVLVAYNIPKRDCGGYSAGGAAEADAYRSWIRSFAQGIGSRTAIVVVEPDALPGMTCLSEADQSTRLNLLRDAATVLNAQPGTAVYIDAGHSRWLSATDAAQRLNDAGISQADGFSLNVSNFGATSGEVAYGNQVSALVGGKHFVVDSSRNGNGANGQWCNPSGRALGERPSLQTGQPLADGYLWVKRPGESDGTCNGGPVAGQFWPEYALGLAERASW
jgi:endoglucanase